MAPPQAPAKRYTAVVSNLASGIMAESDSKVTILDTFLGCQALQSRIK